MFLFKTFTITENYSWVKKKIHYKSCKRNNNKYEIYSAA